MNNVFLSSFRAGRLTVIAVVTLIVILSSFAAHADSTAVVDPGTQYQTFEGWGISLAWWANVIGGFPEPARSKYISMAFDVKTGLGLNIVRYNIGGGENPAHLAPNKQFLSFRAAVPGYEPSAGVWDWTADANQRYVLKAAVKDGADQLEAFSNSPPYWMTVSGSVTGGAGGASNLRADSYETFAVYLATVVAHFHDQWGITFRDLEPLNEPAGGWGLGNYQEGCHFDIPGESQLIKATAAALSAHKSPTTATASDEPSIFNGLQSLSAFDQETVKDITKVNVHSYGGGNRTALAELARSSGKDLWLSEYGDNDATGLATSRRILTDMNGLHPTAWVGWQFVDSSNGWGCLRNPLDSESDTDIVVNEKFYVMANYTKFIRPGDVLIKIDDPHSLCAFNAKSGKLVIVTTNSETSPEAVTYDLTKFMKLGKSAETYQTSSTENLVSLKPLPLTAGAFTANLPAESVTTFVVTKTAYSGPIVSGL